MGVLFSNNASSALASGITDSATSLAVEAGDGAEFPVITGANYFYATLVSGDEIEVVRVTARTGDTFTIVRGQDDTTAKAWDAGDGIDLRLCAAALNDVTLGTEGTADGQIPFWNNTTGEYDFTETSEMVWDDSSKDLRIGGPTTSVGRVVIKADNNHRAISLEEYSGDESWQLGITADGDLFFEDSGTGAAVTFQDGGNVGIGTDSPNAPLSVSNTSPRLGDLNSDHANGPYLTLSRAESIVGDIGSGMNLVAGEVDDFGINVRDANSLIFGTNSLLRMLIDASGNVGIGTSSPDHLLEIEGAGTAAQIVSHGTGGNDVKTTMYSDGNTGKGVIGTTTNHDLRIQTGGTDRVTVDSSGNLGIGLPSPTHKLDILANMDNSYIARFSQDHSTGWGVLIDTDGVANDPALWVKNATDTIIWAAQNGNVGIGTDSPDVLLDIEQAGARARIHDGTNSITIGQWDGANNKFESIGRPTKFVGYGSHNMAFATNAIDRLTIDASGNVGIGTTSPDRMLHIRNGASGGSAFSAANLVLESSGTNLLQLLTPDTGISGIMFGNETNSHQGYVRYSNADDEMSLWTSGAQRLTINAAGEVMVGDTLSVSNGSTQDLYLNPNQIAFNYDGTSYIDHNHVNGDISFRMNGGAIQSLFLKENGNVGIGTTDPTLPLQVDSASATAAKLHHTDGDNVFLQLEDNTNSVFVGNKAGTFVVQTSGDSWSDKFSINSAGEATFNHLVTATSGIVVPDQILGYNNVHAGRDADSAEYGFHCGYDRTADGATSLSMYSDVSAATTPSLRIVREAGVNGAGYLTHNGTGNFTLETQDTAELRLATNSTTRLTIDSAGSVSLSSGTGINEFSIDGTLTGDSDNAVPTEKAVKTYVDANSGDTNRTLDAVPTNGNTSNSVSSDGVYDALATKLSTTGGTITGALACSANVSFGSGAQVGFYGTSPVSQQSALTAADNHIVNSTYSTEERDVIMNLRTRLNELETKLQNYGLLA